MTLQIRRENPEDYSAVEALTRDAFWDVHVPGCDEHYLAHILREAECFIPELDLVAIYAGTLVGNIMYSKALLKSDSGGALELLCFGPLSVAPAFQRKGIGKALVEKSLELAGGMGYGAVIIYGDPDYYRRLGFRPGEDYGIRGQEGMYSPALQVLELVPGALKGLHGSFFEDQIYQLDPEAAARFEQGFPPREKGFRPSQLRFQEMLAQAHY